MPKPTDGRSVLLILAAAALAAAAFGCRYPLEETYPRWTKSERVRLLAFKNIETLGVAEVIDETGAKELDREAFGRTLASELAALKRFRVVYPKDVAAALSAKGIRDPEKSSGVELLEAARAAKMDGVLVVRVLEFKPYYPPRMSFRVRLYATEAHGGLSASEILEWSDDGVPSDVAAALTDRFIWARDELADAHDRDTAERVRLYSMDHDPGKHPMGPEVFLRSMDRFFKFLSYVVTSDLYRDSLAYRGIVKQAERERARREDGHPLPIEPR